MKAIVDLAGSAEHALEVQGDHEDDALQEDPLDAKITQPIIGQPQITVNLQVRAKAKEDGDRDPNSQVVKQVDDSILMAGESNFFEDISSRDSQHQIHFYLY